VDLSSLRESLTDPTTLKWVSIASAIVFAVSLLVLPIVIIKVPEDYFTERGQKEKGGALRVFLAVVRNVVGFVFLVAGIAMLVLPGQGVLMILTALVVMQFPGKKRLECKLAAKEPVLRAMNRIRALAKKPPLVVNGTPSPP
jgi:hypothetical protein